MARRIGNLIALGALLIAGLLPSVADAATLYISEFPNGLSQVGTTTPQIPPQPKIADQAIAISGTTAVSAAFNTKTHAVMLMCDEGCSINFGIASATATTSNYLLQQGVPYLFGVSPGGFVASIANAAGNIPGGGTDTNVNVAQWGGVATSLGQKAMAASVPVVVASDQASFPVTIAAGAAVIGHVITDTGSTTAVTGNVTVVQPTGTNLHTVLDTTSTTAVTQATGTNLHTVVDSGTLTAVTAITNALPAGANLIGKVGIDQTTPGTTNAIQLVASTNVTTLTTAITRPSDTNAYAANDALANSTSAPTSGGFTLTSACRASGGNGTILSAAVSASASTAYQGEIWVFDQAVTATNDNAALSVSDSDILNLVGVIPFNTTDVTAANAISYVTGLNIGYTCSGTANLRYLVKILTAVTPASAEVLNLRVQVQN